MVVHAWIRWGIALGFALGGFFDGILLHQILQWHHLLSLVPAVAGLREQVVWDGYFHALMYGIAGAALWGLWRTRHRVADPPSRTVPAALLIGFGLWHVVDSILSHWLLGIHRVRLDSPNPLMWDLLWFVAFGMVPCLLGWWRLRGARPGRDGGGGSSTMLLSVAGLAIAMAAWSLRPSPDQRFTTIAFAPWVRPADAMNAVLATGGRLWWTDRDLTVMVVDVPPENRLAFYRHGALLVSGTGLPNGCFAWSRV